MTKVGQALAAAANERAQGNLDAVAMATGNYDANIITDSAVFANNFQESAVLLATAIKNTNQNLRNVSEGIVSGHILPQGKTADGAGSQVSDINNWAILTASLMVLRTSSSSR